ncbi:MAG: AtpZ/AtpI family protein [Planctomycetota bacterium]|nr:AtpZ/AtpI family protein [Planctomycetota bacterium]
MSDQNSRSGQRRSSQASQIAQAYRTAHEVLSAALAMGLFVGAGYWLDVRIGWKPVLTICGACVGFVVAGVSLRTLLRRLDQESARKKAQKQSDRKSQSE